MSWQNIEIYFVHALIAVVCNGFFALWWMRRKKTEKLPEDFAVFRASLQARLEGAHDLISRRFDELDRRIDEQAGSILENRRDYVGLRTDVGRIAGQMNFKLWRRETDKGD